MFDLCENSAYARTEKRSDKVVAIKVSEDERKVIDEMVTFFGQKYASNVIRMGLKVMYNEMQEKK